MLHTCGLCRVHMFSANATVEVVAVLLAVEFTFPHFPILTGERIYLPAVWVLASCSKALLCDGKVGAAHIGGSSQHDCITRQQ